MLGRLRSTLLSAPMPSPPQRNFSFTSWATNSPSIPPPGDKLDSNFNITNKAVTDALKWAAVSLNTEGRIRDAVIGKNNLVPGLFDGIALTIIEEVEPTLQEVRNYAQGVQQAQSYTAAKADFAEAQAKVANNAANIAVGAEGAARGARDSAQVSAFDAGVSKGIAHGAAVTAAGSEDQAKLYADLSGAWAEHMPDTIPPDVLAVNAITGDHWSSRWWANKANQAFGNAAWYYAGASPTPPLFTTTGGVLPIGAIWFDTSVPPGSVKIWNGTAWVAGVSTALPPNSVGTGNLQDGSVTTPKLADGAVTSIKIADGTIDPVDLSPATLALISANPFDQSLNRADAVRFSKTSFGGVTNLFPMLKPNGPELQVRLADDSAFGNLQAANGRFAFVGIGTPPGGDPLTMLLNQNASTRAVLSNNSAGNAAYTAFVSNNGVNTANFMQMNEGYAGTGAVIAGYGGVLTTGGCFVNSGVGTPILFGIGQGPGTEKMRLDANGRLGIGMVPVNSLDVSQSVAGAGAIIRSLNANPAATAFNGFAADNGTNIGFLRQYGLNYAVSGMIGPDTTLVGSTGAGGLAIGTFAPNTVVKFGINNFEKMKLDLNGVLWTQHIQPYADNAWDCGASNRWRNIRTVGIDVASVVNILGSGSAGSLITNTYCRRYWVQISSMVAGSNYDVIKLPGNPAPGNTRVNLRTHIWLQNLQPNYSYSYREDMWIVNDTGGSNNTTQHNITPQIVFSVNSGVINCGFSYDFLRSSGLQYIRLWPTCTGANSAGGLMIAYVEVTISGDGAPGAS